MFNDRDLGILGAGAVLAVLCLVLPLPFAARAVIGILILVGFMVAALLRLGPDRVTLEVWLKRRARFRIAARRYTNQPPDHHPPAPQPAPPAEAAQPVTAQQPGLPQTAAPVAQPPNISRANPVHLAVDEIGIYPLATALLAVVGIYFIYWLIQGGGEELTLLFERLIGGK